MLEEPGGSFKNIYCCSDGIFTIHKDLLKRFLTRLRPRLQAAIFVLIHKQRHNLGNNLERGSYTVLAPVPHM